MTWRKSLTSKATRGGLIAAAMLPLLLLFGPAAESQTVDTQKVQQEQIAFDFRSDQLQLATTPVEAQVLGSFDVAGGKITFIDEGESVATVLAGGDAVFRTAHRAQSLADLYLTVAPRGERVPEAILVADRDREARGHELVFGGGPAAGQLFSEDFEVGEDDWAEGCAWDSLEQWTAGFEDWSDDGNFVVGPNDFSSSTMHDYGETVGDINGYFGNLDSIWFGVCFSNGVTSSIQMQYRDFDTCYASGTSSTGFECGVWSPIPGTDALLSPGDRYLYHNHSTYAPLRRGNIDSIGTAQYTGWQYFVSGAATDNFAADDWFQAP